MSLTVRPAVPDDAPAICELLNAIDVIEIGRPETDLHEVRDDLGHPGVDLAKDSWLAYEDGRLVCYGLMWDDSGDERIGMDHYLLPGSAAAGVRLFELMEGRAAERARANGAGRAVVHMHLNTEPTLDTAVIEARDWRRVRRYQVMTRDVAALGAAPTPPPGVRVRDCTAEADRRVAYELCELTFADHFDHRPRGYEEWLEHQGGDRIDWSLVWIAAAEGIGDAAVLIGGNERESMGWIPNLGVVKDARGRGIGGFLLRHAFHAFAGRGRETVGLGVDTENATGALKLYEANGMRLHFAVDTWELIVPV
ncbi:GNAT family N-acetyltransferase [Streptomyces sp. NBC_00370]|uniref:GNAT family N-acetyltransferase n=1 Tax=Streptomyces sp. NBC_00370 TaxID=2975728 RepID=UPI002E2691FA